MLKTNIKIYCNLFTSMRIMRIGLSKKQCRNKDFKKSKGNQDLMKF